MVIQESLRFRTSGRGTQDITRDVNKLVSETKISQGICNIYVLHTSASLMICENADPDVHRDMETIISRLVPDGDPAYVHTTEGPDDMAAHARSVLTGVSLSIPVRQGRCMLGTWQGIYLWEHREHPQQREVMITIYGE